MPYRRPDNVPFPKVWDRFQGKHLIDGKPVSYIIQDITDDLVEPVINHMCRYFLIREVMTSHDGLIEEEVSLKELREFWREMIEQRMGLVALVEGDGDPAKRIAGCNMTAVSQKNDPKTQFKGVAMDRLVRSMDIFYKTGNVYEKYGVDKFLNAVGLSVSPKYQGDSVGYHLLKSRTPLCQATGIPLTVTLFSNPAAIHEALKDGFEIILDTTWQEFMLDGKVAYPRLKSRVVVTAKVIPQLNS